MAEFFQQLTAYPQLLLISLNIIRSICICLLNSNMASVQKQKKKMYDKNDFEDKDIYNEIKEEIRLIREKNLKQVEEQQAIMILYNERKKEKQVKKRLERHKTKPENYEKVNLDKKKLSQLEEDDEEEGEINDAPEQNDEKGEEEYEGIPSVNKIGDYIRPITLTRNTVCDMLKSRKFAEIVKGCFVRYKSDSTSFNAPSYLLAQIVGVSQGEKEYFPNKTTRTKVLLKLQQASEETISLSIDHLSNQHPPGALEISKWLQTNRNKMPKEKELKQKYEELKSFKYGKVSSEQIDKNIFEQAKRIAFENTGTKTDIGKHIYFIDCRLHDLSITLDEIESNKDKEEEFKRKSKQKRECEEILFRLRKKKVEFEEEEKRLKKEEEANKSAKKKYSQLFFDDRKEDAINDKEYARFIKICTFEGTQQVFSELQKAHKQFEIELEL